MREGDTNWIFTCYNKYVYMTNSYSRCYYKIYYLFFEFLRGGWVICMDIFSLRHLKVLGYCTCTSRLYGDICERA